MEITKCPPLRRKVWAFRATIRVWSGWATSAKITSTIAREKEVAVKSWVHWSSQLLPGRLQIPGSLPCFQSHFHPVVPLPSTVPPRCVQNQSHHSLRPLITHGYHLLCAQPQPVRGGQRWVKPWPHPRRRSQAWVRGRQTRHQKANKGEHLQARVSAGLSDENKLQEKGYGIGTWEKNLTWTSRMQNTIFKAVWLKKKL